MDHPGGISREGALIQHGKELARAYHDFDGYFARHAGVTCNADPSCSASLLGAIFDLAGLQLRTDDNRPLALQSSGKTSTLSQEPAHLNLSGNCLKNKGSGGDSLNP